MYTEGWDCHITWETDHPCKIPSSNQDVLLHCSCPFPCSAVCRIWTTMWRNQGTSSMSDHEYLIQRRFCEATRTSVHTHSLLGALLKYFGAPSGTGQDEEPSTSSATQVSSQMLSEDEDPFASTSPQHDSSEMPVAASPPNLAAEDEPLSTDPADWPSVLTDRIQTQLVCRGPSEVTPNFVFPRNVGD
uniref:Uncharacterized protein n=1 Tax=Hucho hucho TaxID=62062 RepID=A0A4W5KZZ6_9TELE